MGEISGIDCNDLADDTHTHTHTGKHACGLAQRLFHIHTRKQTLTHQVTG